jgi:hypothetical protein
MSNNLPKNLANDEAAKWLDEIHNRFNLDTHDLSLRQLVIVRKEADKLVSRLYAEEWGREQGIIAPEYGTPEWEFFHDEYLASN